MIFITNKMGYPSERTRGHQIAEFLGCGVDVEMQNYDETIIAVKCLPDPEQAKLMNNLYFDLIDDISLIVFARRYKNAKIIVLTDISRDFLSTQISNEIIVIPEHSCNFDKEIRDRSEVSVVGYVGSRGCFDLDFDTVKTALKQIDLDFKVLVCEDITVSRQDVVDFYKTIDIQLTFRTPEVDTRTPIYRNPLKVFNAGSFKIPTVAFPEISYSLCAGSYFLEAIDAAAVIDKCYLLKNDKSLYDFYADRSYEYSKQFEIKKIAKLYAALSPDERFNINVA